jgi:hypothetical protein
MSQLPIDFTTASKINVDRLKGQSRRLYDHLSAGNTIHCFSPAVRELRIGYLNSRISDLRNRAQVTIYDREIQAVSFDGELVRCKEYSLKEF